VIIPPDPERQAVPSTIAISSSVSPWSGYASRSWAAGWWRWSWGGSGG